MTNAASKRLRFSLLNILLIMAVAALAMTQVMTYRELLPLRDEVRRLRDETGRLVVEDPTRLHVLAVDTDTEQTWKWRVWIPEGAKYRAQTIGGENCVPESGFPNGRGSLHLNEPGEHVITYRIRKSPRDDQWYGRLESTGGAVGHDPHPWLEWKRKSAMYTGVSGGLSTFGVDDSPVELIRYRLLRTVGTNQADTATGFMIWLERR